MAAEGGFGDYDSLFTIDVVRDFMISHGGKVTNHDLVTHFKTFLNDSHRKVANRQKFKEYVNTLAAVKLDISGEKLLALKKKYRDSGSFRGADIRQPAVAASSAQSKDKSSHAKRAKREDAPAVTPAAEPVKVVEADLGVVADIEEEKENFGSGLTGSSENLLDLVLGGVAAIQANESSAAANVQNVELEPEPRPLLTGSDNDIAGSTPSLDETAQSIDEVEPPVEVFSEYMDMNVKPVAEKPFEQKVPIMKQTSRDREITPPVEAPMLVRGKSTQEEASTPKLSQSSDISETNVVSVREMAKQINKAESPIATSGSADLRQKGIMPVLTKAKRERESRRCDDAAYEFTLSEPEREWTIRSSYSDYQSMAKLLQSTPSLAGRRDFLSGYMALHWAAKNGRVDVVKLLFGSAEPPDVDARSHGGYTALHLATMHGHEEVIVQLIQVHGADPNIRDYSGRKPRYYIPKTSQLSATSQQLLKPPPLGAMNRSGSYSAKIGRSTFPSLGAVPHDGLPSPVSSPGPSSRKGSTHSDAGLMLPPRELPAVVRRRPVISSTSSAGSGPDVSSREKESHSDSEMLSGELDNPLRNSGSTPNFGVFI